MNTLEIEARRAVIDALASVPSPARERIAALLEALTERVFDLEAAERERRSAVTWAVANLLGQRDGKGSPYACPVHVTEGRRTDGPVHDVARAVEEAVPFESDVSPYELEAYERGFNEAALPTLSPLEEAIAVFQIAS